MLYQAVSVEALRSMREHTKSNKANFPNINQTNDDACHKSGEGLNDAKHQRSAYVNTYGDIKGTYAPRVTPAKPLIFCGPSLKLDTMAPV
jgi:hypothetical protein